MEDLDTFLARYPPFDALDPDTLRDVASDATERALQAGEVVLVEDGLPASALWVVIAGSMDLLHEGEVIQVVDPGECFGHLSLLTHMAPAFSVRARETSRCAVLSAEMARRVLGTEAGSAYVATTVRKRLTRTGHTVHALLDVGTTPVSAIMRAPEFCEPDASIRDAAVRLSQPNCSALLVQLEGGLGILTDSDIRAAVAAGATPLEAPLRDLARTPVPTVPVTQLAVEATIDMLASGHEHMAVLDGERVCGVLSSADLIALDASSPIAVRHMILRAADEAELIRAVRHLPRLFGLLDRAGVPPETVGQVLSLQHDAVVTRLIDFSIWSRSPAPVSWAWLDLGSAARREFTLASDQDNALAYAAPPDGEEAEIDAYFERLGADVNAGLVRAGIGLDNNGVLAGKRLWRMSKPQWLRTFDEALEEPTESHLIRATVAFDFRPAAGSLEVTAELTDRIRRARQHPNFMRLLARSASGFPVALGFRGQLATGRDGDPPGHLDIKRGAILPLVNVVRYHALANGVTISSTVDRIEAVVKVGGLDRADADGLLEAFSVISRIRFAHHAERIAAGTAPDNLIDPEKLPPIARGELRDALQVVRRAQRQLPASGVATR
ncbi:MAG TPA: putative nucleotidyltransferase substrate binding domain-containing protein [Solirubrobacteraceae bacterium]|nr:putative nucleotidyltransferase substrate binding domain-containing protein [Solirubrobacteraceae bacterium]